METFWSKSWPAGIPLEINYHLGEKPMFEYLRSHAKAYPNKPAINFYGLEISYKELDTLTDRFASYLISEGLKKGDRVAIYMQNCPQYAICQLGTHKAGGIVVPCGPMFKAWELEEELTQTGTKTIVCQDDLYPYVKEANTKCKFDHIVVTGFSDFFPDAPVLPVHETMTRPRVRFPDTVELSNILENPVPDYSPPNVSMDDPCLLQFTSGTTGLPKAAILTHGNQLYKTAAMTMVYKCGPEDVMLTAMPTYHIAGMLFGLTVPLYAGGTAVTMSRFDPLTTALAINNLKCSKMYGTVSMYVPTMKISQERSIDLTSLRISLATSFGLFLTEEIVENWRKVTKGGVIVEAAYGLSETHTGDTFSPLDKPRIGSVGIPHVGTDIKIMDFEDPNLELPPGKIGEITIKSPGVFKGYWGREDATRETLRDGRVYTGDMGRFDQDGYLYFLGRKKEMIKASGYAIAPEEVEGFLMRHPAVSEAACIPIPDPIKGESVKAFIVLKEEYISKVTKPELIDWAKGKMATYKCPTVIEFLLEIPKNATGKILRRVLKEQESKKGNNKNEV
ncbi:MAG: AMP-binding protein [Desulfomonilaceae bacterium]